MILLTDACSFFFQNSYYVICYFLLGSHAILIYLACAFPGVPDHWSVLSLLCGVVNFITICWINLKYFYEEKLMCSEVKVLNLGVTPLLKFLSSKQPPWMEFRVASNISLILIIFWDLLSLNMLGLRCIFTYELLA